MASGRQARGLSDRAWLRRDEELRRLLCRGLYLRLHEQVVPSLVPVVQPGIRQVLQRKREPERVGGRSRPKTSARSPTRDLPPSTKSRQITLLTTSSSTRRATSRSSWT